MQPPNTVVIITVMFAGGEIAIYSRNSENNTDKYPDIVADLPRLLRPGVQSVVLDCEAVAYDRIAKKILPFQVLARRVRLGLGGGWDSSGLLLGFS